jgi:hypothetical protein
MQTNTNSISAWIDVDHYGFKNAQNLGGLHAQVTMPVLGAIPARLLSTSGILYTKNVPVYTATPQSANSLFYTAGASAKEYQLTRTINNNTQFNLFATNTIYNTSGITSQRGGWTFLAGGMLLMYSTCSITFGGGFGQNFAVIFPIEFTLAPYSITLTATRNSVLGTPQPIACIIDGTVTTTGFSVSIINNGSVTGVSTISVSWMAIGI